MQHYSYDDAVSGSWFLLVFTLFKSIEDTALWNMWFIFLELDLNLTVLPLFLCRFCSIPCEAVGPCVFTVLLKYLKLFCRMSGAAQHACFTPGWLVTWTVYMVYLALDSVDLLGVGWRGVSSYTPPLPPHHDCYSCNITCGNLRRYPPFVNLSHSINAFKNIIDVPVGPWFEAPEL